MAWIKENIFVILWIILLVWFINQVGHVASAIDRLAVEVKRISWVLAKDKAFLMEDSEQAWRQAYIDKIMSDTTRCIMLKREGETVEQFLERTKNCPDA